MLADRYNRPPILVVNIHAPTCGRKSALGQTFATVPSKDRFLEHHLPMEFQNDCHCEGIGSLAAAVPNIGQHRCKNRGFGKRVGHITCCA